MMAPVFPSVINKGVLRTHFNADFHTLSSMCIFLRPDRVKFKVSDASLCDLDLNIDVLSGGHFTVYAFEVVLDGPP